MDGENNDVECEVAANEAGVNIYFEMNMSAPPRVIFFFTGVLPPWVARQLYFCTPSLKQCFFAISCEYFCMTS